MAGRHAFEQLRAGLSAESHRKAAQLTDALEQALSLGELRRTRVTTQEQPAEDLLAGKRRTPSRQDRRWPDHG